MIKEQDLEIIYIAGPATGGPGLLQILISKAPTAKFIPTSRRMRKGWASFSSNSPFPAAFPAMSRRKTPGSIHEGGELG